MTITLRPEQEQLMMDLIRTGGYANPDEAIASALEMLCYEDEWLLADRDAVDAKIRQGIAELDRGEGIPADELDGYLARLKAQQE
jgi:Arc/MetJ-type ribon-helix-helix transcriptional regulator